jgi:hypothetical protein
MLARFGLETATLAILLLTIGGGLLGGAGPIGAVALPLGLAGLCLAFLPGRPYRFPDQARGSVVGLLLLAAVGAAAGDGTPWPGLIAAGLLAGGQRALLPSGSACIGVGGLAAALLLVPLMATVADPADCFAWAAGLALAAVPLALAATPKPCRAPAARRPASGGATLLLACQGAMVLLMVAVPAGAGCGLTPTALAGGMIGHLAAMSAPALLQHPRLPHPRSWAGPVACATLGLAGAIAVLPLPADRLWAAASLCVGLAWGAARLILQDEVGARRGDLVIAAGGAGMVVLVALAPVDGLRLLPVLAAVPFGRLIVQRAFARGGDPARDGWAGVILRVLLHALRHAGIGQQLDQLQRLVEPGRDAAAGQAVAVDDEARMALDHGHAGKRLQA